MASPRVDYIKPLDVPLALDSKKSGKQLKETAQAIQTESASAAENNESKNLNSNNE